MDDDTTPLQAREAKARMIAARDKHYEVWLRYPAVQLLLSLIPPANPPELVSTLLREAFNAGSSSTLDVVVRELERWARLRGDKP